MNCGLYLVDMGLHLSTVDAIDTLTHRKGEPYDDYIKRISKCRRARIVKLADLRHNSDIMRMKGLSKKDFDRLEKYHRAYAYLSY
jgi:hypothetical protein